MSNICKMYKCVNVCKIYVKYVIHFTTNKT